MQEEPIKITTFEVENVKRVKTVAVIPNADGLTVIGGRNGQGKTSLLSAVAYAVGGEKFRPSDYKRDGSMAPPMVEVKLSNGLVVTRKGENGSLTVKDPTGMRGGQKLLNDFVGEFSINLPKFLTLSPKEQTNSLLKALGLGERLTKADFEIHRLFELRREASREAERAKARAEAMPCHDIPEGLSDPDELASRMAMASSANASRQAERLRISSAKERMNELSLQIQRLKIEIQALTEVASSPDPGPDEDLTALAESLNSAVAARRMKDENTAREDALADAVSLSCRAEELTRQLEAARAARTALLDGAGMPLPGMGVEDGVLTYNGRQWDCMSTAEQMKIGTAICRSLYPRCGFVLLDRLECFDPEQLREFGEWLKGIGLQAIATRVATDGTCDIVIEDGEVAGISRTDEPSEASSENNGKDSDLEDW